MHIVHSQGTSVDGVEASETMFLITIVIFILQTWVFQDGGHLSCCRMQHLPSANCMVQDLELAYVI